MDRPIYLDHNATTPLAPEVIESMISALRELWGNPSSAHLYGAEAREAVDRLRAVGHKVSHLTVRTLFPVLVEEVREALAGIRRLFIPEENLTGQYRQILLGEGILRESSVDLVVSLNMMGRSLMPGEIVRTVIETVRREVQ